MIAGRRITAVLTALALLFASGGQGDAQQSPSIAVDPPSQTVALEADSFEVRITVDDVTNEQGLGGYTLVMRYDPAVVQALAIADSGFAASTENAVVCPASGIDNEAGRLAYLCFTIPFFPEPGPQTREPAVLATVQFQPIAAGTSVLDISDTTISDPQGNGLGASTSNGEVIVRPSAPGQTPTGAASTPSAGATPTPGAGRDETGQGALPSAGAGPQEDTDRQLQYIALALAAVGATALLGGALRRAMGQRSDTGSP